jgi:ubiquinone/menaquinone biosynthesis C-methylase UbiE
MDNTKQQVREFYDEIGWSHAGEGLYQNARYEDLRPVSREYIHKCHMRVKRYLAAEGDILLDAGSGPVQWPEYLSYSDGFDYRLCADISITALREARQKLGDRGLFVVVDIANLPFKPEAFDGVVSMHTIHHLPLSEHKGAYLELNRVLKAGKTAVVVNGWHNPLLMRLAEPLIRLGRLWSGRSAKRKKKWSEEEDQAGTFVAKMTPRWLRDELKDELKFQIFPWRSLSARFMRWFVRPQFGGKAYLRLVYWLEETFPTFFGENGQYPMIVIKKETGD